jgi:nitrogen fixation-related uncharacterized protein
MALMILFILYWGMDNAQPDTARLSINFLHANDVNTLPWSSRSPGPLAIMVALHLFCMALMILFILYWGMAFHSMMIAFSNILKRVERMMIAHQSHAKKM